MVESAPSSKERLKLRTALSKLDAVFEACSRLPAIEKGLIYEEIRKRVPGDAPPEVLPPPSATTVQTPATFIERCRGLADIAPNDKVRSALLMVVRACEAEMAEATPLNSRSILLAGRSSEIKRRPF
jgi:hypothetical protein